MSTRPLSALPILVSGAVVAAVLWAFPALDDLVGGAVVVVVAQALLAVGLGGEPSSPPSRSRRVAFALGGAIPAATVALASIPWLARGGEGMQGLGIVVGMLVFGVPAAIGLFAASFYVIAQRPRPEALCITLAIVAASIAVSWILAIAWWFFGPAPSVDQGAKMLAFPGLATAWLLLPWLEWRRGVE